MRIQLSTGEVEYECRGEGRPLVYLHPAGGVRWTPVLEGLSKSFALHVPTFPGFDGTPPHDRVRSRKALGALIAEFIEKKIGKPSDVMGCSFGGCVALWLALQRPELVDHLVLECPAGLATISPELRKDPQAFRKALFAHPEKLPPSSKSSEAEAANRAMIGRYGAEDGRDGELVDRISGIEHKTLIVQGTEDRVIPQESAQLLKSKLRHAFLVYVWDAAHNVEVDQPERMLAVVGSFLQYSEAFVVNRG